MGVVSSAHLHVIYYTSDTSEQSNVCSEVCDDLSAHTQETQDEAKRKRLGYQLSEYKKRVAWLNQVIDELSDDDEDDTVSAKGDLPSGLLAN